ncbi:uncharacterized protein Z520_06242 [Fonsecaea multimorphosa CBS 102226]|uniref:Uncharacterized protein n=1 Tax=Fonsecaea multimorphosa CBS 102226 TaxID=1442371 RepID=A0A0D2JX67_9EURO|nr:uncharacterized protein Z520_06242 [Fonsecaea multimorphosa CBS 102226]KIX98162.1 hypothetical protein Z520_06242 [Fonsecaea multimorphosa CBS 102226]OAL24237.1 hypothetical protein AYO22_05897 [Fonsecaea multimorphosa]
MSSRYDDRDYRGGEPRRREREREREPRERVEPAPRERRIIDDHPERRERDTPMSDVMDIGIDRRVEARPDPRMDRMDIARDPTRANTARSIDPIRSERTVDSRSVEPPERLYQDPATGQMYRQLPPQRYPPREDRDYLDPVPPSRRVPMDATMRDRDEPSRPQLQLSEFWCPGEGIEREVIQHEICKFLGQDATCRPGVDSRGRPGYWVRGYRALTTAMEQSLRDESERWLREKDRRRRQGENRGMGRTTPPANESKARTGSYADLADSQERTLDRRRFPPPGDMDLDEDDYRAPPRHREPRERERERERDLEPPRPVATGRIPVTTGYPPEPGYTQYAISSQQSGYAPGQPAYYGVDREPRTLHGGNTTPPTSAISRAAPPAAYGQPGYPPRTAPPVTQSISASYDGRRGDIMGGPYPPGYPETRTTRR